MKLEEATEHVIKYCKLACFKIIIYFSVMCIIILFEMLMFCNYSDNDAIIKVYNYRGTSYEMEFTVVLKEQVCM